MRAFNDLKLIAKLALPAGLVLIVALGLVGLARDGLDAMGRTTREIVDIRTSRAVAALRVANAVEEAAIAQKSVIIEGDDAVRQALAKQHGAAEALAGAEAERLVALAEGDDERRQDEAARAGIADYLAFSAKVVANAQQGMTDVAFALSTQEDAGRRAKATAAIDARVQRTLAALAAARDAAEAAAAATKTRLTLLAGLGLVLAFSALAAIAVLGIARPLARMARAMNALAAGDLAVAVEGTGRRDEIGALARALQVFKDSAGEMRRLTERESESATRRPPGAPPWSTASRRISRPRSGTSPATSPGPPTPWRPPPGRWRRGPRPGPGAPTRRPAWRSGPPATSRPSRRRAGR